MASTSQILQQDDKLQLIEGKMDYLICEINKLLKQKGSEYEKCFVDPDGDKKVGKLPVHMDYRGNQGLFRNSSHAEILRCRINEEDDVQWRRRNNTVEENEKGKELKHQKLVFPSFNESDNARNWDKECEEANYGGAPIYDEYDEDKGTPISDDVPSNERQTAIIEEAPHYEVQPTYDQPPQYEGNFVFDDKAEFFQQGTTQPEYEEEFCYGEVPMFDNSPKVKQEFMKEKGLLLLEQQEVSLVWELSWQPYMLQLMLENEDKDTSTLAPQGPKLYPELQPLNVQIPKEDTGKEATKVQGNQNLKQAVFIFKRSKQQLLRTIDVDDKLSNIKREWFAKPNPWKDKTEGGKISEKATLCNLQFQNDTSLEQVSVLKGKRGEKQLVMLVDSDSTLNFLNVDTAKSLDCPIQPTDPVTISLPNGKKLLSQAWCPEFTWSFGTHSFSTPMWLIKLQTYDAILGTTWLKQLGEIQVDYGNQLINFMQHGEKAQLHGRTASQRNADLNYLTIAQLAWMSQIVKSYEGVTFYSTINYANFGETIAGIIVPTTRNTTIVSKRGQLLLSREEIDKIEQKTKKCQAEIKLPNIFSYGKIKRSKFLTFCFDPGGDEYLKLQSADKKNQRIKIFEY